MARRTLAHCLCAVTWWASSAAAEPAPVSVSWTNATTALYNLDNRDDRRGVVSTRANDDWGVLHDRLTAQASHGVLSAQLRLDAVWFFARPDAGRIAEELALEEAAGPTRQLIYSDKLREAEVELASRFQSTLYATKYSLDYLGRDVDVSLGDFYAQLGRGFVLSVRKVDELGSDTTIRGVRVSGRVRADEVKLELTALGGVLNPLRMDEASGRRLAPSHESLSGILRAVELGMPHAGGAGTPCQVQAECSMSPDSIVAAGAKLRALGVGLGTQASLLLRTDANSERPGFTPLSPDVSRSAPHVLTASQFLDVPELPSGGAGYVEAAFQKRGRGETGLSAPSGHALYAHLSLAQRPLSVELEAKHYRRFFPLSANVSLSRAREFSGLVYNSVPTTTPIWLDTELESFNTCTSGGRLRGDLSLAPGHSVHAWLGRYLSWAERVANERCDTSRENENSVWHAATGTSASSSDGRRHAELSFGVRFDDSVAPLGEVGPCVDAQTGARESSCVRGQTSVFYREGYLRYELRHPLWGAASLEHQGWHRRRRQTQGGPTEPWLEGQHATALAWGSTASFALGLEYDQKPGTPDHYVNAQATWRPSSDSSISLSGGQRRSMLRCVSGICRVMPAFEGLRLDVTTRF